MRLPRVAAALVFPAAVLACSPSLADDGLTLSITPYGWLPGVNGTVGVGPLSADLDVSFSDIVDTADDLWGVFGRVEGRSDRLGFYADGGYMWIGVDDVTEGPSDIDVVQRIGVLDVGLMYRLVDEHGDGSSFALDATAGARYWNMELEIDPANLPSATRSKDWILPTVGLRGTIGFARRWEILIGGDIGGFGAGSDFAWSAIATIGYTFTVGSAENSIFAGYKAMSDDFSDDDFTFDATLHGPVFGWRFTF